MKILNEDYIDKAIEMAAMHFVSYGRSKNPYHLMNLIDIFEDIRYRIEYDKNIDLEQRITFLRFYEVYCGLSCKEQCDNSIKDINCNDYKSEANILEALITGKTGRVT